MATGTYAPDADLHVVDANGVVVPGGLVWTYLAGTTTPVATYSDVALTVPNSNPIVAGSDGRFVAFLTPGTAYKFVYETAPLPASSHGAVLITRDNIGATVGGPVGGQIAYTDLSNTFTTDQTLKGTAGIRLNLTDTSQGVDAKTWRIADANSRLVFNPINDAGTASTLAAPPLQLDRAGSAIVFGDVYEKARTTPMGGWISIPFNASNFTAGAGTWTLQAGDQNTFAYALIGKVMVVTFIFTATSVSTACTTLTANIGVPFAASCPSSFWYNDPTSAGWKLGYLSGVASGLQFTKDPNGTVQWAVSTDTTYIYGTAILWIS